MASKVTFFYTVNLAGFSETHYLSGQDPSAITTPQIVLYLAARLNISGYECTIQYVRAAKVGSPRTVRVWTQSDLTQGGLSQLNGTWTYRGAISHSDFGGTALLVRKFSAGSFSRFFLRGIPDFMIENGGLYKPTASYQTFFQTFAAVVASAPAWSWKSTFGTTPNARPLITGAVQGADGTITYTLGANLFDPILYPAGTHAAVRISGQVSPRYLNGPVTVTVLTQTTCTTLRPTPLVNFVAGTGKMLLPNATGFQTILNLDVERVVKRGPGRPFGLYRGRQTARATG
jgi:hypothetical protein